MNAQTQNMPTQMNSVGLLNLEAFELSQRVAKMLASSTLVPEQYRAITKVKAGKDNNGQWVYQDVENPNGLSNCVIALNMANRMGADPLMIMQNLYLIEGRPSWSSQFIMASINSCGRFSALRFEIEDLGEKEVEYQETAWVSGRKQTNTKKIKIQNISCMAWVIERESGERLESSKISIEMAVKEGWYQKNGSKWQTMPEQMLRYRAASFFGRVYAPELLMGLRSADEEQDRIIDITPEKNVAEQADINLLKREILGVKSPAALDDAENKVLMLSDDVKREELLKLVSAQAKKFQPEPVNTVQTVEPEQIEQVKEVEKPKRARTQPKVVEEAPAAETQEQVVEVVIDGKTSDDLHKKYNAELNKADSKGRVNEIFETLIIDDRLKDAHKDWLKEVATQCKAKFDQQETTTADPIKSNMAKGGLKNQIANAPSVEALKEIAATVRDYKLKLTDGDMGEVLADYSARKKLLEEQQDMFVDVVDAELSYVESAILRIQNAKSQDDINDVYADPAFEELSGADQERINKEAQQREAELQD